MDDRPRRPSPDLSALLAAIKRRNKEALAGVDTARAKAASLQSLSRALRRIMATDGTPPHD
ncbi:hypothetical protein [Megalodesulfovibrio paquesii]